MDSVATRLTRLEGLLEARRPEVVEIVADPEFFGRNERNPHNGEKPRVIYRRVGSAVELDARYPDRLGAIE